MQIILKKFTSKYITLNYLYKITELFKFIPQEIYMNSTKDNSIDIF